MTLVFEKNVEYNGRNTAINTKKDSHGFAAA